MAIDFLVLGNSSEVMNYQARHPDTVLERHTIRGISRNMSGDNKYVSFEYRPGMHVVIRDDDLQKFNATYAACAKSNYASFVHKDIIIFKRNNQPVAIAMLPIASLTRGSHLGAVPTHQVYAGRKRV